MTAEESGSAKFSDRRRLIGQGDVVANEYGAQEPVSRSERSGP
jgi:hypothetical protein